MNDKLEAIRKACIAANPEIMGRNEWRESDSPSAPGGMEPLQTVRLADVLLAVRHSPNGIASCYGTEGDILVILPSVGHQFSWKLHADDLEQQSEETINFLYELLK